MNRPIFRFVVLSFIFTVMGNSVAEPDPGNIKPGEIIFDAFLIPGHYIPHGELQFTIEAEDTDFCSWINGATVDDAHDGFNGDGYVNTPNEYGTWTQCEVMVPLAGKYRIAVKYAHGKSGNRTTQVIVNGTAVLIGSFHSTGSWSEWDEILFANIPLNAGYNTIRLTATTSEGLANIDCFYFYPVYGVEYYDLHLRTDGHGSIISSPSGSRFPQYTPIELFAQPEEGYEFIEWGGDLDGSQNPTKIILDCGMTISAKFKLIPPTSQNTIEAEDRDYCSWIRGSTVEDEHDGYSGEGYVNTRNEPGVWTQCEVTVPIAGNYQIVVRYANGENDDRDAGLAVNGTHMLIGSFESTNDWSEWNELSFRNIPLDEGENTIRLTAITPEGLGNIDCFYFDLIDDVEYYDLHLRTNGNGSIRSSPSGSRFPQYTRIELFAEADEGYRFVGWRGDMDGSENPATVILDCGQKIIALFEPIPPTSQNTIEAEDRDYCSWSRGSTVDDEHDGFSGEGYVNTPNETGVWTQCEVRVPTAGNYRIGVKYANGRRSDRNTLLFVNGTHVRTGLFSSTDDWSEWDDILFVNIPLDEGDNTIRLIAATSEGLANIDYFEFYLDDDVGEYYELNLRTEGNGSIVSSPSGSRFPQYTPIELFAQPEKGYRFVEWRGEIRGSQNPTNIILESNMTIIAKFEPITTVHTLTVEVNGAGSYTLSPDKASYYRGESVTITAIPEEGGYFTGWSGGLRGHNNPERIFMYNDQHIIINFEGDETRMTIEAEDTEFCSWIGETSVDDEHDGFDGDGYVNTPNETGAWIQCEVTVPTAGNYKIAVKYANGIKDDRAACLVVNGTAVFTGPFKTTGGWSEWSEIRFVNVRLYEGNNTIRLEATTSGGLPNVDRFIISQ